MRILIINGPNLNLLGNRENGIYGDLTLEQINNNIKQDVKGLAVELDFYQSNYEGDIITKIQECKKNFDALIINPAAYSHYSIAILDAIRACGIDVVEVHISNIYSREDYRKKSITSEGCKGVISGFGYYGYVMAVNALFNSKR